MIHIGFIKNIKIEPTFTKMRKNEICWFTQYYWVHSKTWFSLIIAASITTSKYDIFDFIPWKYLLSFKIYVFEKRVSHNSSSIAGSGAQIVATILWQKSVIQNYHWIWRIFLPFLKRVFPNRSQLFWKNPHYVLIHNLLPCQEHCVCLCPLLCRFFH